jgi:signal transduction histidine kinase
MSASLRRVGLGLRERLLRVLLVSTALGATVALAVGWVPGLRTGLYPWVPVWLLLLCGATAGLMRRDWTAPAAGVFAAGITVPVAAATLLYGVASPAPAWFVPGLIVGGLIVGSRRWLVALVLVYGWIALAAWGQWHSWWSPPQPIAEPRQLVQLVLFWWLLFTACGWVAWVFARHLEQAVQLARGQTAAMARTVSALTASTASSEQLLGQVLAAIAEQLAARWVTLWFYERATDSLSMVLTYEEGAIRSPEEANEPMAAKRPLAGDAPFWQELVRTRRPIVVEDIARDARLLFRPELISHGVQSLLLVPLIEEDDVIGWLSVRSTERRRYRPEELDLAMALSQQVTLAVQMARLAEQAQQAAVLNERDRLAREIHDTLAQGFTGIVIQLEAAEDALVEAPEMALDHLARARALARDSLAEARRSVLALRPLALEHYDLPSALRASALALASGTALAVEVRLTSRLPRLDPDMEADLLRIGQEAVTNVVKYADARRLAITLSRRDSWLVLEVRDDGRGFNPEAARRHSHGTGLGLTSMRERAEHYGGTLTIDSGPGGTRIVAELPLSQRGGAT